MKMMDVVTVLIFRTGLERSKAQLIILHHQHALLKLGRKSFTFCAFIDFRKAYDCINRNKLWQHQRDMNASIKMLSAFKSL